MSLMKHTRTLSMQPKGAQVNAEQRVKSQSLRTGVFATLRNLFGSNGTGAPADRPVNDSPGSVSSRLQLRPSRTAQVKDAGRKATGAHSAVRELAARLRTPRWAVVGATLVGVLLPLTSVASAQAATPWWHLETSSRPTYINPNAGGPGTPQTQKLTVTTGTYGVHPEQALIQLSVGSTHEIYFATEPIDAIEEYGVPELNAANIQTALEGPYGGSVTVTESPRGPGEPIVFNIISPQGPPITTQDAGVVGHAEAVVVDPGEPATTDGEIYVNAENLGTAPIDGTVSPVQLKDILPAGLTPVGIAGTEPGSEAGFNQPAPIPCHLATLSCELKGTLAPYDVIEMRISVNVASPVEGAINEARISGGGAAPLTLQRPLHEGTTTPFGVREYAMTLEEEGGGPSTRAAAHPLQFTTQISLNQGRDINPITAEKPEVLVPGMVKDVNFNLPPGLIGNPRKLTTCTTAQFFSITNGSKENRCPASSAVGAADAVVHEPTVSGTLTIPLPIFNMEPNFGEPARFGFYVIIAGAPVFIDTSVRSGVGQDYGITATVHNITQTASFLSSTATFWGVPGAAAHESERGWGCFYESRGLKSHSPCVADTETHPPAVFSNPTDCSSALSTSVDYNAWEDRSLRDFAGTFSPSGTLGGCNQVPFGPAVAVEPTSKSSATATGLTVDLNLKQEGLENAEGLAESDVKQVTLALPTGVTTNPAVANGLSACSLAQYEAEELANQSCPESSKVGEVEIESPLVAPIIHGSVYVAKQHDNPADNLLSIYMVAKNPELGVLIKSAGKVEPNEKTGQLTTTFGTESEPLPQLPFSHFHFAFRTGERAPLITPGLCGRYTSQADLYPWSNPNVATHREVTFEVTSGANGKPCATQESQLPNKPSLEAGTLTPIAGAYSPFVFKVRREDGSQALSTISATLPEGLLGKLAGIKECSAAQIAQAQSRSGEGQGATELASPSCPASSEVGTVNVGTGVGSQPYYVQGNAYLAGPYKGAPLSLAIITPAVVGPFDLGTIVVRTALYVNEFTAQITAKSDPIPTIVHGLPTVVQSISLNMNRPSFTINPTSCDPKQIEGSATSTLGAVAPLSQRFQVGACGALGFKPGLKLSLSGQTRRAGHPALKAVLTYPKGSYANIARAQVSLPGSEFLDQGNLNLVCKQADLKAGTCPKTSIYGKVKAWSPLLEKPLVGNVYLGVGFGFKLPALVAELNGQIRVLLVGKVDTDKQKGIRNTFQAVPDAAVSRFELSLKGGKKYGLLENSENICKKTQKAKASFTAQNGKVEELSPTIANSCGKGKGAKGKKKGGAGKGAKSSKGGK
jgi:hypothetical protein